MEAWRRTWREGVAPALSQRALKALKKGLETHDARIIQGNTTNPPPMETLLDWPIEAACPLGFALWQGEECNSVLAVEEGFMEVCRKVDEQLNEPAACRYFFNWVDETPREEMIEQLLPEVILTLEQREERAPTA